MIRRWPSDALGELPDGAGAGPPTRLALDVREDLLLIFGREQRDELLHRDQVVPDIELLRPGVVADPISVGLQAPGHGFAPRRSPSARDSRARTTMLATSRETSHSNGPGRVSSKSRRSNDRLSLRGGPQPEVEDVGVAAQLHGQARVRARARGRRPSPPPRRGSTATETSPFAHGESAEARPGVSRSGP